MVLGIGRLIKYVKGDDDELLNESPIKLPDYFPAEPMGCQRNVEALFQCLANEATDAIRDMEKNGIRKAGRYYPDTTSNINKEASTSSTSISSNDNDDPLEPCRLLVYQYKKCCNKQLKKKHNQHLMETYRVQEEYRYDEVSKKETS